MEEEDHTVSRAKDQPGSQVQRMGEIQALLARVLARVLAATGPDRELDAAVWLAAEDRALVKICVEPIPYSAATPAFAYSTDGRKTRLSNVPRITDSLDAALALVERALPGAVRIDLFIFAKSTTAAVWPNEDDEYRTTGKTPALAVLTALLTALSHQQPHDQIREGEGQ